MWAADWLPTDAKAGRDFSREAMVFSRVGPGRRRALQKIGQDRILLPSSARGADFSVPFFRLEEHIMKRTYQPNNRRRKRKMGFRARQRTRAGRTLMKRRRLKGRQRISA